MRWAQSNKISLNCNGMNVMSYLENQIRVKNKPSNQPAEGWLFTGLVENKNPDKEHHNKLSFIGPETN